MSANDPTPASSSSSTTRLSHDGDRPNPTPLPDPDLLVLAFQELDLSAEALLYSTKTTREEAWCAAALAGLGEKAVEYEKVGFNPAPNLLRIHTLGCYFRSLFCA